MNFSKKTRFKKKDQDISVEWKSIVTRGKQLDSKASGHIDVILKTKSYLHIGAGSAFRRFLNEDIQKIQQTTSVYDEWDTLIEHFSLAERQLAEFNRINDRIAIPGSTLKGAVRSNIEISLRDEKKTAPSCYIVADSQYNPEKVYRYLQYHNYPLGNKIPFRKKCPPLKLRPRDDLNRKQTCTTCQMFGKMGLKSLLSFSPAFLQTEDLPQTIIIQHQHGANIEIVKEDATFSTRIMFLNLSYDELGLLIYAGLKFQDKLGLRLGYKKYSQLVAKDGKDRFPMGHIETHIQDLSINGEKYEGKELLDFLNTKVKPQMNQKFAKYLIH